MRQSELKKQLCSEISDEEYQNLKTGGPLYISEFNRTKILEMFSFPAGEKEADTEKVKGLREALKAYLSVYMKDRPEAHKWIIIACLYLSFIKNEPLHPQNAAGFIKLNDKGKCVYFCPLREDTPGSICSYCICRKHHPADVNK